MGNKSSREVIDKKFVKKLNTAIRSSQEEFSDLVVVSLEGTEHHSNKLGMMIAFPKLREYLLTHARLDTFLSDEVIFNLDSYAMSEVLTLDDHLLELVGVLLELVPIAELEEKITDEVLAHVKNLLTVGNIHETLTVPAIGALVFVAKIHDLDSDVHVRKWTKSQAERCGFPDDIYQVLWFYSMKAKKEDHFNPLAAISNLGRRKTSVDKFRDVFKTSEEGSRFLFLNED